MSLGENLKEQRRLKMMTQKELSEKTGIKVAHLSRIENDEGDLKLSTIYKLINALNCTPNDLLLDESSSLDARLSTEIEKVLEMPKELKEEISSVINKYIYFSKIAEITKAGQDFMKIDIDEMESAIGKLGDGLLEELKKEAGR